MPKPKAKKRQLSMKTPGYYTMHWGKDGQPSGSFWHGRSPPNSDQIPEGFFCVYHPPAEIEITMLPCTVERKYGLAYKISPVDLSQYTKKGTKLLLNQRISGIL